MVGLMKLLCDFCIHHKRACALVEKTVQKDLSITYEDINNCPCKQCLVISNCSVKCIDRNQYIDNIVARLDVMGW